VKSAYGFPLQRIAVAVALSILLHGFLLWQLPDIEFPVNEEPLPQLQAKLEPLPKLAKKSVARKPKVKHRAQPIAEPAAVSAEATAETAASRVPVEPAEASAFEATDTLAAVATVNEEIASPPLLPKHAQLRFAVQYGAGTFKVGEVVHVLENIDGHYTLRSATQTTGLVSLFKSYQLTQTSTGSVSKQGLRPDSYIETKVDSSGTQTSSASFDWTMHKVYFNNGQEMPLAAQAQDVLSLPYQLSQLPLNTNGIPVALSNGRNIAQYYIAVGEEGTITTGMGELRTITLSKVHGANEDGLIIWLALEYRLLPVKMLYLDKSGEVSANMVITDIRVSDE